MSVLIKAAVFGGLAYFVTRALRNPEVRDKLMAAGESFKSEHRSDETMWPTSSQQTNYGPSSQ